MKLLPFVFVFFALPALAQTPAPPVLEIPSGLVLNIHKYLGSKPVVEAMDLFIALENCMRAQAPGAPPQAAASCPGLPVKAENPKPEPPKP